MRSFRILLVDDHAIVRRGLTKILKDEFSQADFGEAGNAAEAIEKVRQGHWDVVVLDITLPGRSGLDVLKEIRLSQPRLPVLVLSMHPEDQYAKRVLRAGASGYMTKESAPDELATAVRNVCAGGKYVSAALAEKLAVELEDGSPKAPHEKLSDREYEVMRLIAAGKTVSEIAAGMSLSVKTVSTYRSRILEKTGMKTNAEVMRYVMETGIGG
jgi:DNA-binding NarL/FixJ family response regulator